MKMIYYRRASILILVLFLMSILALVAVSFAYRVALKSRNVRDEVIMIQLKEQAASAVAIAIGRLKENTNEYDHPAEPWHSHKTLALEDWLKEWNGDEKNQEPVFVTDYQVIDEESKYPLANASSETLEKLGMSKVQIAGLFDWIDKDDIQQSEGAEHDYYSGQSNSYFCKNALPDRLEELLLIRGFSAADYLGEDANHNGILDTNENDGALSYPPDDADGKLRLGWVDLLTCVGNDRININTAPQIVLECLPITANAVSQITGYREFDESSSGDLKDHVFTCEDDIDQLQGLSDIDREVLKNTVTFKSSYFRIFVQSVHLPTGLRFHLQVLVRMNDTKPEILQWKAGL